ncbi:hypothetical protein SI65_09882 [Aspergillus cristatus]|uniref:Uncharacterized protein n=1 Tax=Aspergillus cristatus TaxID=573508 RepID=A0A1E3B179_ASPCR|nr:hypothetical protein SI65_09882 [Aspergillus cristatus]
MDQLPSWLWVRGADQFHPFIYPEMVLASRAMVPRDGEYDVVCRNCYSTIDNLHRSVSQSYGPSPPPAPVSKHANLSDPRGHCKTKYPVMPELRLPFVDLSVPGVSAYVEDPYVGMCLVECPWPLSTSSRLSSVFPISMVPKGSFSPESDDSIGSRLNPEAVPYGPSLPAPYALSSPTRAQPIDDAISHLSRSNSRSVFSVGYTGANEGFTSTPAQKFHAALEQLKNTIGVHRDLTSPELEPEPALPVTRYLVGKEGGRRPWKNDRHCRGGSVRKPSRRIRKPSRRVRKPSIKRLSSLKVASPRQVNAATKRQDRREKLKARINHGRGNGRRYSHRPWRTQMANR